MSNASITAASLPLEFVETVDGKTRKVYLQMSPLSDVDISELDLWVQTRYIRMARQAAADLPQEKQGAEIEIAQRTAAGLSAFSGAGARMIASVNGMARVVWQSIHAKHPEVSEERIKFLLFNPANLSEANAAFKAANFSDIPLEKQAEKKGRAANQRALRKELSRRVKG